MALKLLVVVAYSFTKHKGICLAILNFSFNIIEPFFRYLQWIITLSCPVLNTTGARPRTFCIICRPVRPSTIYGIRVFCELAYTYTLFTPLKVDRQGRIRVNGLAPCFHVFIDSGISYLELTANCSVCQWFI